MTNTPSKLYTNLPDNVTLSYLRTLNAVNLAKARRSGVKFKRLINENTILRNRVQRFDRAVQFSIRALTTQWRVKTPTRSHVRQIVRLLQSRTNLPQTQRNANRLIWTAVAQNKIKLAPKLYHVQLKSPSGETMYVQTLHPNNYPARI